MNEDSDLKKQVMSLASDLSDLNIQVTDLKVQLAETKNKLAAKEDEKPGLISSVQRRSEREIAKPYVEINKQAFQRLLQSIQGDVSDSARAAKNMQRDFASLRSTYRKIVEDLERED